ncbi:vWA domain-containing protein, partial [Nostoc sp.]
LQGDEANKRVAFFTVGVENANMTRLNQITVRTPLKLKGLNFIEMFVWLSTSMSAVSHSQVDEQVALPPIGWGTV